MTEEDSETVNQIASCGECGEEIQPTDEISYKDDKIYHKNFFKRCSRTDGRRHIQRQQSK